MDAKYCNTCVKKLPIPFFLKDTSAALDSRVFASCIQCRERAQAQRLLKRTTTTTKTTETTTTTVVEEFAPGEPPIPPRQASPNPIPALQAPPHLMPT
jgi:hypothetical protein